MLLLFVFILVLLSMLFAPLLGGLMAAGAVINRIGAVGKKLWKPAKE